MFDRPILFGKFSLRQIISYFLPLAVLAVILAVTFYGLKKHSQSWYFQDETDHLTNGWMMWKYNKGLYTDLSVNHQPLPFLLGALITKLIPYNTLFLLVERIRVALFILMASWLFVLTWRFRWRGLFVSAILASTSYLFFGWYLLGETLAAPALALSLGLLIEKIFKQKSDDHLGLKKKLSWVDPALFALASAWITMSLSPLWPYVFISGLAYAWYSDKEQKISLASTYIILLSFVFIIVSPIGWYKESIRNVMKYVVDIHGAKTWQDSFTAYTYPFQAFLHAETSLGKFFIWQNVLIVLGVIFALKSNKSKLSDWSKWLLLFILVLSLNNRVFVFPTMFYTGFHLYPFIAAWGMLIAQFLLWSWSKSKKTWLMLIYFIIPVILIGQISPWILEKKNKLEEHFIGYGDFQSTADIIKVLKEPTDTLLTGPDGAGYINIIADVPIAGKELFHLPWAWRSPEIRANYQTMLMNNPPTYVLFDPDSENGFHEAIKPKLDREYTRLKRLDGRETKIMVRTEKLQNLTEEQKQKMIDLYFMTPQQLIDTKDAEKI
ncbi:hypothetical protein KJZ63_01595 [Patescibacteria group bacterium]|nr:hypothetical protein [Patescibacteria group bacterium]